MKIDFVVMWVDGNDPSWQKKMRLYKGTDEQLSGTRYRDWDIFRYWFRSVEKYAPWVHHIYLITDNQKPSWLNPNHPKLSIVDHKDFIPTEFLPTFNSHTIELNIHRIQGLSEYFIAFNDDMFINASIDPEYYFKKGLPCDATLEHIFSGREYSRTNGGWGISIVEFCNIQVLNAHFNRYKVVSNNKMRWYGKYLGFKYRLQAYTLKWFHRDEFQHFFTPHNEKSFLKSIFEECWKKETNMLLTSCTRFRENVSLNIYFIRLWQLAKNLFFPTEILSKRKVIQINYNTLPQLKELLLDSNIKSLCINDSADCTYEDYQILKPKIIELFENKLPEKSSFEL